MKFCKHCQTFKPRTDFAKRPAAPDGLRGWCKTCENKRQTERRNESIDKTRQQRREWYYRHREKEKERSLMRRNANRDEYIKNAKQWRKNNPDRVKANKLKWNRENPDKCLEMRRRKTAKMFSTADGRLNHYLSGYIRRSLHGKKNGQKWESLVGYTLKDLMSHLEQRFQPGMNWDNKSKWDIDHIIPLSRLYFDSAEDPTFKFAWSLKNLQPLWKEDNNRKGNKMIAA